MIPRDDRPIGRQDHGLRLAPSPLAHHLPTDGRTIPSDLTQVVEAWDRLPDAVRAGIVAMIRAAAPAEGGQAE